MHVHEKFIESVRNKLIAARDYCKSGNKQNSNFESGINVLIEQIDEMIKKEYKKKQKKISRHDMVRPLDEVSENDRSKNPDNQIQVEFVLLDSDINPKTGFKPTSGMN